MKNINLILIFEWLSNYNISYKYINSFFDIFRWGTVIYIIFLISLIGILIFKIVKISNKINQNKVIGLSKFYDRCLFEDDYLKFGGAILIPSVIFIIKLYSTLQFLHFAIVSLILLTIFIGFTSQFVIDFLFNVVVVMDNVNEALDDFLNILHKQSVNNKTTKSFVFNILGSAAGKMSNSTLFYRAYSTGPNIVNSEGGDYTPNNIINNNNNTLNDIDTNNAVKSKAKISNLKTIVNVDNEIKNNTLGKEFTGGFKGYKIVKLFDDIIFSYNPVKQMLTIDKKALNKNIVKFLKTLSNNKTYTALFSVDSWNDNKVVGTLSEHSILIHKDFPVTALVNILDVDINRFMNKYMSNKYETIANFKILVQYREWVNEEDYSKEKFMAIKKIINKNSMNKLKKLTSLNKIVSDDVNIMRGLKNMNFYNFNLPYNYWFEKELFFNNIFKNSNINISKGEVFNLYNKFFDSLNDKAEYIIEGDDNNNDLKIIFSNVVNNDIKMVKDWNEYSVSNNRFIRQAEIYIISDKNNDSKALLKWIDYIGLDENISKEYNKNNIIYLNSFRVVERNVQNIKFSWSNSFKPIYIKMP